MVIKFTLEVLRSENYRFCVATIAGGKPIWLAGQAPAIAAATEHHKPDLTCLVNPDNSLSLSSP